MYMCVADCGGGGSDVHVRVFPVMSTTIYKILAYLCTVHVVAVNLLTTYVVFIVDLRILSHNVVICSYILLNK